MTAKQRANRERFKKVVAEAKKLRKKNQKLTQAQAVKQAWAIMYSKGKVGAATKVKAKKGKKTNEMHTDTKSHNVNIRVVSGVNNLVTGTKTQKLVKQYLIDSIDLRGYGTGIIHDPKKRVGVLADIFEIEYGWAVSRYGKQGAIKEWLQGLPSSINIAFNDHEILELAKKWGALPQHPTESQENKILNNYWNLMASQLLQLFTKVGKKIGAVKIIQKGESKSAKVSKVLQQTRTKRGTFKGYKRISGLNILGGIDDQLFAIRDNLENSIDYYMKRIAAIQNAYWGMTQIEKTKSKLTIKRYKTNITKLMKQLRETNALIAKNIK